jgi:hypothetical protein
VGRTALGLAVGLTVSLAASCGPSESGRDASAFSGSDDAGGAGEDAFSIPEKGDVGTYRHPDTGAPPPAILVYSNTDTSLLSGDPTQKPMALTAVGDFDCLASGQTMTDIAIDQAGNLFGVSESSNESDVYPLQIQGGVVHGTGKWKLPGSAKFYGLTFAPAGVLRATEMLVAANGAGELWAIDEQGNTTQVGTFGTVPANDGHGHTYANAGKAWELSGDIVFLTNNGNPVGFATVRDCPKPPTSTSCNRVDTLVEIDISKLKLGNTGSVTKSVRGEVVKSATCTDAANTGYGSMFGIAAWADKVYGFSRSGNLVEISNQDGTACLVQTYPKDAFSGAGVTTLAPVIGPN